MAKPKTQFLRDENGAVTVDWVILTAGVVGLAAAAYVGIEQQTQAVSDKAALEIAGEVSK
jgi:Flp pilus assembly pilin Flp